MNNNEVLSLASRRRIFEFVRDRPGSHLREVARSLSLPLGTALYHLEYLCSNDMMVVRRDGRYKRFFVKDLLGRREKDYISAFHHAVPHKIAQALLVKEKSTQRELCKEVGVSRSTLSFHVNSLVDKGILRREDDWPENRYYLEEPEVAERVLTEYRAAFRHNDATARFEQIVETMGVEAANQPGPAAAEAFRTLHVNAPDDCHARSPNAAAGH